MTLQQLLPDLLCATILLLFLVVGAIRGMFRTLSGLLTWLLSLWGAKLIADRCAPLLVDWLTPKLLPTVSEKLAQAMSDGAASDSLSGLLGVLPGVQSLLSQAGDSLAAALAPAVARQVALAVGWLLLFAAGFIVFKLACRLLIWLLDLLDEVPGLHFLNHLGGAALGVLKGGLLIAVVVSILLWCDVLPRSMVDATLLLRWLASLGPVY